MIKESRNKNFTFGFIGRFNERKNLEMLIEAFSLLPKEIRAKTRLILTGYVQNCCKNCENYYDSLKRKIEKYNLQDKIELRNALPMDSESIIEEYNNTNVLVYPSLAEGTAKGVLESLSCGVPVIIWKDCPGIRELASKQTGWTYKNQTANSLSRILKRSFIEYSEEMRIKARAYISDNYNLEQNLKRYQEVFDLSNEKNNVESFSNIPIRKLKIQNQ